MTAAVKRLVVIHTNDIHSFFEQMPKIKAAIDRIKSGLDPGQVLVVDCGDHMDRMRIETEGSLGLANVHIMNRTGYEAAILGNNEGLTFTPDVLAESYRHADFRVIGSNMREAASGRIPPWMTPYHIADKDGVKVGMIGVTAYYPEFYKLLGWEVEEPIAQVSQWVRRLRPQTDILIVFSHLGLAYDQQMAEEIEGIDLILGGHTHHLLEEPLLVNKTYIGAAGKFGQHVGVVDIRWNAISGEVTYVSGYCEDVARYESDPEIAGLVEHYAAAGRAKLTDVVSLLQEPLHINWYKESALGNLLARGIRLWTEAEIGLVNAGQVMQSLPEGEVTAAKLLEICPAPINPCKMTLSGELIRRALEESLLREFIENPIRGYGFRGKMLGTLCVDGLTIEYDPAGPPYGKITGIRVNGEPLKPDRQYEVGTIDMFTFGAGLGYSSLRQGADFQYYLPEFIRDVLRRQLQNPQEIARSKETRWHSAEQ